MAAKAAPSALIVATRAADGGCGAGYSNPPFALQVGLRERRPKGPADSHQHHYRTCRVLSSDDGRPTGGERPAALLEPLPRVKLQRRAGIGFEIVQNIGVPVPQMVEQLPETVQFFASLSPVPEQVIEVPKSLPHDVPMRRFCREPQLVEQLVEVPTIVSFSSLQRTVK